jgi:hypothetical protein
MYILRYLSSPFSNNWGSSYSLNHCVVATSNYYKARIRHHCTSVLIYILRYSSSPFSNNWGSSYSHNHCVVATFYLYIARICHHCTSVPIYILTYSNSPFSNNEDPLIHIIIVDYLCIFLQGYLCTFLHTQVVLFSNKWGPLSHIMIAE